MRAWCCPHSWCKRKPHCPCGLSRCSTCVKQQQRALNPDLNHHSGYRQQTTNDSDIQNWAWNETWPTSIWFKYGRWKTTCQFPCKIGAWPFANTSSARNPIKSWNPWLLLRCWYVVNTLIHPFIAKVAEMDGALVVAETDELAISNMTLDYLINDNGTCTCKLCGEVTASRTHWYRHKYKVHIDK